MAPSPNIETLHKDLFEAGIKTRREVVGDAYVDKAIQGGSSDFAKPMQELVTEMCWGHVWNRPGLERKQRSLLNIGMLSALNRGPYELLPALLLYSHDCVVSNTTRCTAVPLRLKTPNTGKC